MIYWCEPSFEGVLTAVFVAHQKKESPMIRLDGSGRQQTLDGVFREIRAEEELAARVRNGVENRMSSEALQRMYTAWLSEDPSVPDLLLHAIRIGVREGAGVMDRVQDPDIFRLQALAGKVTRENHFFTGALRFIEHDSGVLYAEYTPDYNVTELLAPHFLARFPGQPFLIHDRKRTRCAVSDGEELFLADVPPGLSESIVDADPVAGRLWRQYHDAIVVEGRRNSRLQRSFLPVRYHRYLAEME